ncbi:MAG: hypothetical protein HEQ22_07240 [Sphingopyxis sp.]|uniref:hypothetical protein n=1 Tax=Sphingopyxis sp. TaxID=1908224 RepID=UPI003D80FA2F
MRSAALLLPLLLLSACQQEPAFDDRYDKAAKDIEARAKAMDADLSAAEAAAPAGDVKGAPQDLPPASEKANPPPSSGE